jgi:tetratricopeptide (TPR) repeat protein
LDEEIQKLIDEAEKYRSMKVKQAAGEKLFEASARLAEKGEHADAVKLLTQAVKLYEEERSGKTDEFFERAATKFDEIKEFNLAGENYVKAARRHSDKADHRGAIPLYLKAAEAYKKSNLLRNVAENYRLAAIEYEVLGEPIIAAQHIEREADARLELKDVHGTVRALNDARDLYLRVGKFNESAKCFKKAAEAFAQSGNKREADEYYLMAADDLQKAAEESIKAKDHNRSPGFLLEAASIYQKGGETEKTAVCHLRAAEEYLKGENTNEAAENYRKATIEYLLTEELETAKNVVSGARDEKVRSSAAFKQSLKLVEVFEKGDEEGMNLALREIGDFSWVRLCLAFGKFMK